MDKILYWLDLLSSYRPAAAFRFCSLLAKKTAFTHNTYEIIIIIFNKGKIILVRVKPFEGEGVVSNKK